MKLCVTSEAEFTKCVRMSTALRAQVMFDIMLTMNRVRQQNSLLYLDRSATLGTTLCGHNCYTFVDAYEED